MEGAQLSRRHSYQPDCTQCWAGSLKTVIILIIYPSLKKNDLFYLMSKSAANYIKCSDLKKKTKKKLKNKQ